MATRITYTASVSFEYDQAAPQTYQGSIVAANHAQAVRRALTAASRAYPGARPRSLVVVLEIGERATVKIAPRRVA